MTSVSENQKMNMRWEENVKHKQNGSFWKRSYTGGPDMVEVR